MKRLLWTVLAAIGGAIILHYFSRRRMDTLYSDVSRLREVERRYNALLEKERRMKEAFREDIEEMEGERASRPPLTPEQKMKMAMSDALYTARAREALGEHFIEPDEEGEDDS